MLQLPESKTAKQICVRIQRYYLVLFNSIINSPASYIRWFVLLNATLAYPTLNDFFIWLVFFPKHGVPQAKSNALNENRPATYYWLFGFFIILFLISAAFWKIFEFVHNVSRGKLLNCSFLLSENLISFCCSFSLCRLAIMLLGVVKKGSFTKRHIHEIYITSVMDIPVLPLVLISAFTMLQSVKFLCILQKKALLMKYNPAKTVFDDFSLRDALHVGSVELMKIGFLFLLNICLSVGLYLCSAIKFHTMVAIFVGLIAHHFFNMVYLPAVVVLSIKLNYVSFEGTKQITTKDSGLSFNIFLYLRDWCLLAIFLQALYCLCKKCTIFQNLSNNYHTYHENVFFWKYKNSYATFVSDVLEFFVYIGLIGCISYFVVEICTLKIKDAYELASEAPANYNSDPPLTNHEEYHGYVLCSEERTKPEAGKALEDYPQDFIAHPLTKSVIIHKVYSLQILQVFQNKVDYNIPEKSAVNIPLFSHYNTGSPPPKVVKLEIDESFGRFLSILYDDGTITIFELIKRQFVAKNYKYSVYSNGTRALESFFKLRSEGSSSSNSSMVSKEQDQDPLVGKVFGQYIIIDSSGIMYTIRFMQENLLPVIGSNITDVSYENQWSINTNSSRISSNKITQCHKMITLRANDRLIFQTDDNLVHVCQEIVNKPWRSRPLIILENAFNTMKKGRTLANPAGGIDNRMYPSGIKILNLSYFGFTFIFNPITMKGELIDVQTGTLMKTFKIDQRYCFDDSLQIYKDVMPTFCKFCGSASIKKLCLTYNIKVSIPNTTKDDPSFSEQKVLMKTHIFKTNKKNKKLICLRVERDPREIRCFGLESVSEKTCDLDVTEKTWFLKKYSVNDPTRIYVLQSGDAVQNGGGKHGEMLSIINTTKFKIQKFDIIKSPLFWDNKFVNDNDIFGCVAENQTMKAYDDDNILLLRKNNITNSSALEIIYNIK